MQNNYTDSSEPSTSIFFSPSVTNGTATLNFTTVATGKVSQTVPSQSLSPSATATEEDKSKNLNIGEHNIDRTSSTTSAVQVSSEATRGASGLHLVAFTTYLSALFAARFFF
jgi:hypothetical protein